MPAKSQKEFPLAIIVKTVDRATAQMKQINDRINRTLAPMRRINRRFRMLGREAGLPRLASGFKNVGKEARAFAFRLGTIAAAAGITGVALKRMLDSGDELAKTADRIGLSVDALAQLRHAGDQFGVETQELDSSLGQFVKRLGEAKTGMGSMHSFLERVSPALLKQVKSASSVEEAFNLMSNAMAKVKDPAKRAALANAAFGRSGQPMINMLVQGSDAIEKMKKDYFELAGSQENFARGADNLKDAMARTKTALHGMAAGVLTNVMPALEDLANRLTKFFVKNRERFAAWAEDFGRKLPGRIEAFVSSVDKVVSAVAPVIEAVGGLQTVAIAASVIIGGKLVAAIVSLSTTLLTTPLGLFAVGVAGLVVAGKELVQHWHLVKDFFGEIWDNITTRFQSAVTYIQGLLDKILSPIREVQGFLEFVGRGGEIAAPKGVVLADGLRRARAERAAESRARVTVDFQNAPPKTRIEKDKRSTADVDLGVGYQMRIP